MKDLVSGPLGSGKTVSREDVTGPAADFFLGGWLLELPDAHPVWSHYHLTLVHLREDPAGVSAPVLDFPEATHELMLSALNPDHKPDRRRPMEFRPLRPVNATAQFAVASDEQAVSVLQHVAQALADGSIPAEPEGIMGARAHWTERVRWFAGHVMETGCEEAQEFAPGPEEGAGDGR